jgi:hypothetical protein
LHERRGSEIRTAAGQFELNEAERRNAQFLRPNYSVRSMVSSLLNR